MPVTRRGPALPYALVAGVVPCAEGWLVATAKLRGPTFAANEPVVQENFADVLARKPAFEVAVVDAPIGDASAAALGERSADAEARALLGPSWTLGGGPLRPSDALHLARHAEVAAEMAPYRQRVVFEGLPELSYFQLHGGVALEHPRDSPEGLEERLRLFDSSPGLARLLDPAICPEPTLAQLDAFALLWSARRVAARGPARLPADPTWDGDGMRVEIVR